MINNDTSAPFVAIWMVTYNHAAFIEHAVESIMFQHTSFTSKLYIGEDCSTDNTREICLSLKSRFPDKIELLLNDKNEGIFQNARQVYDACFKSGARYVAMLEGDDCWNDPDKLQKQVDFLEANPDYVISCHNSISIDGNGKVINSSRIPDSLQRDFTKEELIKGAYIFTLTLCYRNVLGEMPPELNGISNGDLFLTIILGNYGKAHFQKEISPALYRQHSGGLFSHRTKIERLRMMAKSHHMIAKYFQRTGSNEYFVFWAGKSAEVRNEIFREWLIMRRPWPAFIEAMRTVGYAIRHMVLKSTTPITINFARQFYHIYIKTIGHKPQPE